jgi:predicted membrane protein
MKNNNSTFFWAFVFIVVGGLFLMRNFDMLHFTIPFDLISWRLIPLFIGISALLKKDYINGIMAIAVAVIFYIPDFLSTAEKIQYYKLWPLLLVAIGISILLRRKFPEKFDAYKTQIQEGEYNHINESNIMAGSSKKFFSKEFIGGRINCIMGGSEVNLTEADLVNNSALSVFVMMGGIELRVPKEWNIQLDIMPIAGGVEDKITKYPENVVNPNKRLIITGYVIMGGIVIKRY